MLIHSYLPSGVATVVGVWSGNTPELVGSLCQQVIVKAATATTTFTVTITNSDGVVVRRWEGVTGELNDVTPFPVRGILTFAIADAINDEAFTVLANFVEGEAV
jgi:hypothetical protein